jgi:hypothetical protein
MLISTSKTSKKLILIRTLIYHEKIGKPRQIKLNRAAFESEIIETFKGAIKKNQTFTFYFHAEEGYDVNRLIGNEWIVFLQKNYPIPTGGKDCYELENSKLTPSKKLEQILSK